MNTFKEVKETTNSSVYRKLRKEQVANKTGICTHCKWHRGENFDGYHSENASWKMVTKKPKQFLVGKKVKSDRFIRYSAMTVCFW